MSGQARTTSGHAQVHMLSFMGRRPWGRHWSPGYDVAADPTIDEKFARVRAELMPNGPGVDFWRTGAILVDVRRDGASALFVFEWEDERKPLALRIDLEGTSEEFYYEGQVASFDEWLVDLAVYVQVSIGTGVAHRARRIDRSDYIELVGA
jgi:hypothetical protein